MCDNNCKHRTYFFLANIMLFSDPSHVGLPPPVHHDLVVQININLLNTNIHVYTYLFFFRAQEASVGGNGAAHQNGAISNGIITANGTANGGIANGTVTHTTPIKNGTDKRLLQSETSFTISDDTATLIPREDTNEQVHVSLCLTEDWVTSAFFIQMDRKKAIGFFGALMIPVNSNCTV